jgi:FkbM family methyltransferase
MVFVDVGAQFGYFSLLASHLVGPEGRVFAFEPTRTTFELLRANVAPEANVQPENLAAYNTRGRLRMLDFGPYLSSLNTLQAEARLPDWLRPYLENDLRPVENEVEAVPLDDYFAESDVRLDFVKIDAESADHQVLQGMTGILTRQSPTVAIESGDFPIAGAVPTAVTIRFLGELGYRPFEFQGDDLVPHQPMETYDHGNLYFMKA